MVQGKPKLKEVVFEGNTQMSFGQASNCVQSAVLSLFGEAGMGQTRAKLIKFDEKAQTGIVKTTLAGTEKTICALALKTSFEGKPLALRLQKISGAIGKLG